jgi:hypothetical protein
MKIKHYLTIGVITIAFAGVLITGCSKTDNPTTPTPTSTPDYTAAEDDANGSFAIQDTKNVADGAAKGQASERLMSGCEVIRKITPDTIIGGALDSAIDIFFGNVDCNCLDGRPRRGHIIVYWSHTHPYLTANDTIGMTFKNYFVNDVQISGSRTLTNTSLTSWNLTANLSLVYPNNGGTATWNATRTATQSTVNTVIYWVISGSASGVSRKNVNYTVTIGNPLYYTALLPGNPFCFWVEAGGLTINSSNFAYPIAVGYGTALRLSPSDCHDTATITINNVNYTLTQW